MMMEDRSKGPLAQPPEGGRSPLGEQFAQVREALPLVGFAKTRDERTEAFEEVAAALSSIERHVQDMARWIDTVMAQGGPVTSDYEEGERLLAALPASGTPERVAREKGTE